MKQLAEADMQEVVKEIKEIYIDFLPIGTHLFGLGIQHPLQPMGSRSGLLSLPPTPSLRWVEDHLSRTSQALAALLLSLRLSPTVR